MTINHPTKASKQYALLGWFVFFSVLAHGLFLALPTSPKENKLIVKFSSPLQVTVVSTRSASKTLQTNSPAETKSIVVAETKENEVPVQIRPAREIKKNITSNVVMKKIIVAKSTKPPVVLKNISAESHMDRGNDINTNEDTQSLTLNNLRQQLKESIKARFSYPVMARRMGWEGLVGLSLHIEHDGSLNQIRIAKSSGHKILDENARKTIQNIGRVQLASNLAIQAADTEIEVLYKLTD